MDDAAQALEAVPPLLEMTEVRKEFPNGTVALRGVNLSIGEGSVHGLVGANGAGKSTLIKIISGAQPATSGRIWWRGTEQRWNDPSDARSAGVATNYQHAPLVPALTVLENVFLGRGGFGRQTRAMLDEFQILMEKVGYQVDPNEIVGNLPIGARQMVAILQAVALGARLVVLDEPTASLADRERDIVFDTVRRLSAQGTTFLYVSHFLDEILELTDKVTVLRDGQVVLDRPTAELDESLLVQSIVGGVLKKVEDTAPVVAGIDAPVILDVANLSSPAGIDGITFTVRSGEILGLAGLLGSGRSEILHAIFGADPQARGQVHVEGNLVHRSPTNSVAAGMAYVPEDRVKQGLFSNLTLWQNESLPDIARLAHARTVLRTHLERNRAREVSRELRIVAKDIEAHPTELSGGNAQKVVFGKWLHSDARVWILDEPTVGIDVGAKADILLLARRFASEGKAVVVVSSEFSELFAICSKILVVRDGRIVAERAAADTDEAELLMLANGLENDQSERDVRRGNS